jgi:hypothetical protein
MTAKTNQVKLLLAFLFLYFVVTEAIPVFVEFHEDVSFDPQYNAKLWFICHVFGI